MSTQASRYAHHLLDTRAKSRQIPCLTSEKNLSITDAYDIARCIADTRIAQGETPIGRKIGFAGRRKQLVDSDNHAVDIPVWAHVYDGTVRYAEENRGVQSLVGAVQPRLEAEIVFKLSDTPKPGATLNDIADCIEWMAHGIEVVVCPFRNWKFEVADAIAAFGLHGTLIIGEPHVLSFATKRHLGTILGDASVSLSYSEGEEFTLHSAGFGNNVLGSPLHALLHLHQTLQNQPQFQPLRAGEIIATGSLTDGCAVRPGQTWLTAFAGLGLPGLTISFV